MEKKTETEELKQFLEETFSDSRSYEVEIMNNNTFYRNYIKYEIINNDLFIVSKTGRYLKSTFSDVFEKKYTIWKRKQKLKSLKNS